MGIIVLGILPLVCVAEDGFPLPQSWNPYEGWDMDLTPMVGVGLFPTAEVTWAPEQKETTVPKSTSSDTWVKLAYYPPGTKTGEPAILAGYVGGRNYNAMVTITGKNSVSEEFRDIVTVKAQDNGVFVWAVPDALSGVGYFQAVASVSGTTAKSEIVSTSSISGYVPADNNLQSQTQNIATSQILPATTSMTLAANTLHPGVGDNVQLSGRLTDNTGKGVSGVTITIEVPDYGTDFLPLTTTTTGSDGTFSATITTKYSGGVPVRAVFEGNDKYLESTSNTLTFITGDTGSSSF